jgi:DNA polymerase-1
MPESASNSLFPSLAPDGSDHRKVRLFLIDGHSLIYRAYFAIPRLSTSSGLPTNAIYGFTNMLLKVMREKQPDYIAVVFDAKGPTQRHLEYEEYKAERPEMPDDLQRQLPSIHQIVEALHIPVILKEGYEADDLIGTLARISEQQGYDVVIVSGDKDMFQLITPHVRVYDTMKDKVYELADVRERFGVEPERVVEIMGLMGDSIDNIPGVPGIGEKTAVALIQKFGTIENLLKHLDQVSKPKLQKSLSDSVDWARMSRQLATIKTDCPIDLDIRRLRRTNPDTEKLVQLFRELEFGSLLKNISVPSMPGGSKHATESQPATPVLTSSDLNAMKTIFRSPGRCAVHFWKMSGFGFHDPASQILGMAIGSERGPAYYIPLHHEYTGAPHQLDARLVLESIQDILHDPDSLKIIHAAKPLYFLGKRLGQPAAGPIFDTEIASYLLHPTRRDHSLETVLIEQRGKSLDPMNSSPATPIPEMLDRATEIVNSLFLLRDGLEPELRGQGLLDLYQQIELPLTEILAEMEINGIRLDIAILNNLSKEMDSKLAEMTARIYGLAEQEFNINSPKQLSQILFEKLGLKPIKRTKTGYSTGEEVLQQLAFQHELPAEILAYRQLHKLKTTYVDVLPTLIHPVTGRLHTTWHQTVTATGRLASSDPNLQNIPVRGEYGERIRQAFIAEPGYLLLSADYNQIELRLLAHLSQDERLLSAFRQDQDIHTSTATQLFGLKPEQITSEMRRAAKTVNFGIVYGISPYGLSTNLGIPQDEAKRYIDQYFAKYEGVKRYMDSIIRQAEEKGYVTTVFGRRRPIPELQSSDPSTRNLGERTAVNTVIQGSAADLIKLAMIKIAERLRKEAPSCRMLLQIHDELVFEVLEDGMGPVQSAVKDQMEGVMPLSVPLKVDLTVGRSWSDGGP